MTAARYHGDLDFYSDEALAQREALRDHPGINTRVGRASQTELESHSLYLVSRHPTYYSINYR